MRWHFLGLGLRVRRVRGGCSFSAVRRLVCEPALYPFPHIGTACGELSGEVSEKSPQAVGYRPA
jgi:hypothetical protein